MNVTEEIIRVVTYVSTQMEAMFVSVEQDISSTTYLTVKVSFTGDNFFFIYLAYITSH